MRLYGNNCTTVLISPISAGSTIFPCDVTLAQNFPDIPGVNDYLPLTLEDRRVSPIQREIVYATAFSRTNGTFTVTRAREGTVAQAFNAGAVVSNRLTAFGISQAVSEFYSLYLGSFTHAPTTDPLGNPLVEGATYWDSTLDRMFVWTSGQWLPALQVEQGISFGYTYVATAGQTVFTGPDMRSNSLLINTANTQAQVFLNGAKLVAGTDYTTSTNTVTLATAALVSDVVDIVTLALPSSTVATSSTMSKVYTGNWTFNGTNVTFPLQNGSGGTYTPASVADVLLSLDGVLQNPVVDFSLSGSNITLTVAPKAGTSVFCLVFVPS